jgi:hypothetical protein
MTLAIQAMLAMIGQLLPLLTSSANASIVESIISTLSGFLPFIIQEVSALYEPVKNIIAALSASPATNAAQLVTLQALDKTVDDAFDAAAAATDAGT